MTPLRPWSAYCFGAFRIDFRTEKLMEGDEERPLTPKAFALLVYLIEREQGLATKRDILDAVWPDAVVGDAVLKVTIREIRKALRDDSRSPAFIETIHRKGYRFLKAVERARSAKAQTAVPMRLESSPAPSPARALGVRRAPLVEVLHRHMAEARRGRRRAVFLTGEAGLGKTTLAEQFVAEDAAGDGAPALVLRGGCLQSFGAPEDLHPLLEALGAHVRDDDDPTVREMVARYAPTCWRRFSWLVTDEERAALERSTLTASPARERREMADLVDALARRIPVVLLLEDLHWGDPATLDLVNLVARRRDSAQLFMVASLRPTDAPRDLANLYRSLVAAGLAEELRLPLMSRDEVRRFLEARGIVDVTDRDVERLIDKTEGHPLFLEHVVRELGQRSTTRRTFDTSDLNDLLPRGIEPMIRAAIDRLTERQRRVLEAGSVAAVAGSEFGSVSVGAALALDSMEVEAVADALVEETALIRPGAPLVLPDAFVSASYRFEHVLTRDAVYESIPESRRMRYHDRIVTCGVRVFGERADEIAHEMAVHFERAGRHADAALSWEAAALRAARSRQPGDSLRYYSRALATAGGEDPRTQARISWARALARRAVGDAAGAEEDLRAADRHFAAAGEKDARVEGLLALAGVRFWSDRALCLETAEEAFTLATDTENPQLITHARGYLGHLRLTLRGFDDAEVEACEAAAASAGDADRRCFHLTRLVWLRALLGDYDGAADAAKGALAVAEHRPDAQDVLVTRFWRAWSLIHRGSLGEAFDDLDEGTRLAEANAHRPWACLFGVMQAHLLADIGAYAEALDLCDAALHEVSASSDGAGQVCFHAGIIKTLALARAEEVGAARASFAEVKSAIDAPGAFLDQILFLPFHLAGAEAAIVAGDDKAALDQARELFLRAERQGERSYVAMANAIARRMGRTPFGPTPRTLSDPAIVHVHRLERRDSKRVSAARDRISGSLRDRPEALDAWLSAGPD